MSNEATYHNPQGDRSALKSPCTAGLDSSIGSYVNSQGSAQEEIVPETVSGVKALADGAPSNSLGRTLEQLVAGADSGFNGPTARMVNSQPDSG
ncbi:hypothetical protein Ancab_014976, partial [Ancistrocladus abbreviatus]